MDQVCPPCSWAEPNREIPAKELVSVRFRRESRCRCTEPVPVYGTNSVEQVYAAGCPSGPFSLLARVQRLAGTPHRTNRTAPAHLLENHRCRIARACCQPTAYKSLINMQMCLTCLHPTIKTLPILCRYFCKPAPSAAL